MKEKRFKTKKDVEAWEVKMRDQLSDGWQELTNTVSLGDWSLEYLDYAEVRFVAKTYKEKLKAFKELFKVVDPTMLVDEMTTALAMQNS